MYLLQLLFAHVFVTGARNFPPNRYLSEPAFRRRWAGDLVPPARRAGGRALSRGGGPFGSQLS